MTELTAYFTKINVLTADSAADEMEVIFLAFQLAVR